MTREQIEQILREYQGLREWQGLRDAGADPELEAVRLAILLEDVLGTVLSDDDIDLAVLSDPDAILRLVAHGSAR